jgi:hypothetical protein
MRQKVAPGIVHLNQVAIGRVADDPGDGTGKDPGVLVEGWFGTAFFEDDLIQLAASRGFCKSCAAQ